MAKEAFVSVDGGPPLFMKLEIGGFGLIPVGTVARGRLLCWNGRGRLVDPKRSIEMRIDGYDRKAIGNAGVYRASRIIEVAAS